MDAVTLMAARTHKGMIIIIQWENILDHLGPTSVNNLPDGTWDCNRPPSRLVIARRSIEMS